MSHRTNLLIYIATFSGEGWLYQFVSMKHINDFLIPYIEVLRQRVLESPYMSDREKFRAEHELDEIQETIAYRV